MEVCLLSPVPTTLQSLHSQKEQSAYNRRTKRSSTNLSHLTLAPLTAKFPIGDEDELPDDERGRGSSYMEAKSIPTTPSILSRNPTSTSLNAHQRSKSHSILELEPQSFHHQPQHFSRRSHRSGKRSSQASKPSDPQEWLLRAGAAISSETRESKGQSWLVSRASSTSLTSTPDDNNEFRASPPFSHYSTPLHSRSRFASRQASRVPSRRPSRTGSRVELITPMGIRTPGRDSPDELQQKGRGSGYFGTFKHGDPSGGSHDDRDEDYDEYAQGPDFVDVDEESDENEGEEDEEMSRLTRQRGFGLGGLIDKIFGFSLFADDDDDDDHDEVGQDGKKAKDAPYGDGAQEEDHDPMTPKDESAKESAGPMFKAATQEESSEVAATKSGATAWQDATWLLSVAAKSLS
ncbi:MAG: hypothetical protein M1837_006028 [Sclerophora amabilis]|nr:MAG: hypothetical protein M1837_006028 [Sclerophora amabilis]